MDHTNKHRIREAVQRIDEFQQQTQSVGQTERQDLLEGLLIEIGRYIAAPSGSGDLALDLAFEIEDPCGEQEIALALSVMEFAKAVPSEWRRDVSATLQTWTRLMGGT